MSRTIPKWVKDAKYHFCAVCGRTDDLQYHHWEPDNGHNTVPENIIVLCARHHQELHGQGGAIMHNYLVKEGMAKAKERGVRVGKPPADYENVMRMIAENSTQFNAGSTMTEHEIMEMAGVKEVCYAKCKKMLIEKMESGEWPYEWSKPTQMLKRPLYDRVIKKKRGEARGCV
jgi:hypothetical protein